ncbi:MAG: polymer-forming cytoskeletal protein [Leptospiraceae bacterium]|nr:polymer-forming cytoskeletal protein [Leptospiraceae bacterium]MCP5485655.1 polymer-forming cytoskeletal protein [Spirochaetales bacterium]
MYESKKFTKLGKSLTISDNQITVDEDLFIDCNVNASRIEANNKTIVIGENATVTGEIHGRVVQIIGKLTGNVNADHLIQIEETAELHGDVAAPLIKLASRCRFYGQINYT